MNVQVETDVEKMKATVVNLNDIGNGNLCSDRDYENATDATHGSLALKAYQQNLYLKYYY